MSDDAIRTYVTAIDWDAVTIFGAFDESARLVGMVELCDTGEIAVAVAVDHRERGVARQLMLRALEAAECWEGARHAHVPDGKHSDAPPRAQHRAHRQGVGFWSAERACARLPQIGEVAREPGGNVSYAAAL